MRLVVVSLVGLLAACDASVEQQRRDVSTSFCQCEVATPFALEQCITEVLPLVEAEPSEACMSCVYANSQMCSDLFDDCAQLCFDFPQP
jgi:hypothetical protein